MSIRAECSGCGKVVKAGDDWAGKVGKCPACGTGISFFAASAPPVPPPLPTRPFAASTAETATHITVAVALPTVRFRYCAQLGGATSATLANYHGRLCFARRWLLRGPRAS